MKQLDRFSDGTRIKVRIVSFDNGWTERQLRWLKNHQNMEVYGHVVIWHGAYYFRPDRCNFILLKDQYIRIEGRVE